MAGVFSYRLPVKRAGLALLAVVLALGVTLAATAPPELVNRATVPDIGPEPAAWLEERESRDGAADGIIPGTEKHIRWYGGLENSRTEYAVVYLHGFSATRQEIAPVSRMIADRLGANLFATRLSGHGLEKNPLAGVRAEDWLDDAAEALTVGAAIGEKVIVMGTSTGATLALAMAGHPVFEPVNTVVLLSPNFGPGDPNSEFLTWPGGPQLARLVVGDMHRWTPHNEQQALYWSTEYPMEAVVEMMRLVDLVRSMQPLRLGAGVLTIYSPEDTVIDIERLEAGVGAIDSPRKQQLHLPGSGDPGSHVLAGDIMAPENNLLVSGEIVRFVNSAPSAPL